MGIWSVYFPGDEGVLADLYWSDHQTSSGITLKNQIYYGTSDIDVVSFAQLSLSYNPYQSEVYLYEGNDSVRTVGTASGTKFFLGDGDDFVTVLDGLRYSRIEGGSGDDTVWIKQSLFDREGLYRSIITTDTGSDYILIEKEDRLADSMTGILGGGIFSGDGDDRLVIRGYGLLVQSSESLLTYADGSTSRDGIINLGEGRDFLGIEKWNALPPAGSSSAGSSPYLLNSDIDLGGGDDIIDLRSLDFSSSTGVLVKGGGGYDVAILPLNISTAPDWLQGFEAFAYAPIDVNRATISIARETAERLLGQDVPSTSITVDQPQGVTTSVNASTWNETIRVNRAAKAAASGDTIFALQVDLKDDPRVGSVLQGSDNNDVLRGQAGWDLLDGGRGNDLVRGGNGRDIITGDLGNDELHGDFGWNTFTSQIDGFSDLIVIKSDEYLFNWFYGKAGNNSDGGKCDIIEGLDNFDKIRIIGCRTEEISFVQNVVHKGVTGTGLYAKGALEALYIGGNLTTTQLATMTTGDSSADAMENRIFSYGWPQNPGSFNPSLY